MRLSLVTEIYYQFMVPHNFMLIGLLRLQDLNKNDIPWEFLKVTLAKST